MELLSIGGSCNSVEGSFQKSGRQEEAFLYLEWGDDCRSLESSGGCVGGRGSSAHPSGAQRSIQVGVLEGLMEEFQEMAWTKVGTPVHWRCPLGTQRKSGSFEGSLGFFQMLSVMCCLTCSYICAVAGMSSLCQGRKI